MKQKLPILLVLFLLACFTSYAQTRRISGRVTASEDGTPIPGVSVTLSGANIATTTDENGSYIISVPPSGGTLTFSSIGFTSQAIPIGTSSTIDVSLSEDATNIGEVVVVGYGTTSRRYLTGNVATVRSQEIENVPVPNFTEALQGRMAGVFVESASGKVGEGVKVRVRGTTSVSGGNDPLYVIDGIPMTTTGALGYGNPLTDINPNDIESFEVLKDASAAAIYGARGANGVVLITTKSGSAGRTKLNASYQRGFSEPTRLREWLNAAEYVELFREAGANVDDLAFVDSRLNRYSGWSDWTTNETDTDWQSLAFNPDAGMHIVNLSASGGNDKTQFYFGGSVDNTTGILIRNHLEKISGRLNLTHTVNDKFTLGANFGLTRTVTDRLSGDNAFNNPMQLVALSPITPVRDLDGNLYDRPTATYYNNLIDSENADWSITNFRNISNVFGEYKILPNLSLRSEFGVDILTQNQETFFGTKTNNGQSTNGYGESQWRRAFNYNTNNYLTYTTTFDEKHDLDLVGGMSFQKSVFNYTNVIGEQFPTDELRTIYSAADITGGSSTINDFSFLSYFARANYRFANKYLLTLSGRFDASSRFGADNRFGFFPAASAGWIISEEEFFTPSFVNLLKLKSSYGLTGNAEIGNYESYFLFTSTSYGQQAGLRPAQLGNPSLGWEKTAQFDVGLEFNLWNGRLGGEVTYYNKQTTDLLLSVQVPATTGYTIQVQNIGSMSNKGIEIQLNSDIIRNSNFTWTANFNFARNINEVLALAGSNIITPNARFLNSVIVGEPIAVFYGAAYAGVNPDNGDPLWYTNASRTATTDVYDQAERHVLGSPLPDWIAGHGQTFSYKGFDLNFLLQSVYGNQIYEAGAGFYSNSADWFDNQTRDQLRRWRQPGDITDVPQARLYGDGTNGAQASSRYLSDGSYLRLKTLSFGYNLPASFLQRLNISTARVFVLGQNLLTFTNYKGWDPEVNTDYTQSSNANVNLYQGNDFYSAPQAKTFSLGINVGF